MARGEYDAILAECLDRLARGESVAACLARYPQHAAELGPALAAAAALTRIGAYRMPEPARTQAKARMRRALAARDAGPAKLWRTGWARGLAVAAFALLLVALVGTAAAGSRPGDWAYPFRSAAERAAAGLDDFTDRLRALPPADATVLPETPSIPQSTLSTPFITSTPERRTPTATDAARTPAPAATFTPTATPTITASPTVGALQPGATETAPPTATRPRPQATPTGEDAPEPPEATETPRPGDNGSGPGGGGGPGSGNTPEPGDDNSGPGGGGSGNTPEPGDDNSGPGGSGSGNTPEPDDPSDS
jgi:hypothetical protein